MTTPHSLNRYLVTYNALADGSPEGFRGHMIASLESARAFADTLANSGYRTRIWQQLPRESSPATLGLFKGGTE